MWISRPSYKQVCNTKLLCAHHQRHLPCALCLPLPVAPVPARRFYLAPKIEDEDMEGEGEAAEN
jgi:hypothetical protein